MSEWCSTHRRGTTAEAPTPARQLLFELRPGGCSLTMSECCVYMQWLLAPCHPEGRKFPPSGTEIARVPEPAGVLTHTSAPRQLFHAGGWNTIPTCLGGYSAVHGTHRQIAIHISTSECQNQRALEIFLWYYPTMTQGNFDAKTNLGPRNHRFGRCATAAEPWSPLRSLCYCC